MSTLKKWLQSNQLFDKDLLSLLPKYNIDDPEKDLKNLTKSQWNKIKTKITTDRAKELKDNAAKLRLQKKLNKFEKLWKSKRPKKKSPTKSNKNAINKSEDNTWDHYNDLNLSDNEEE